MSKLILRNSEGKIIKEMPLNKNETNEEWFASLSTEEKAKWFADNFGFVAYKASGGNPQRIKEDLVEYWQEWLKQPHREK